MSIHVIVLNYNGRDLLEECLPSVAAAVSRSPVPCRLSVLDNGSTDGSREWVEKSLPGCGWLAAPANNFLFSFNAAVAGEPAEAVLLLNNDIKVEPDFIAPLWKALAERPQAFCAAPLHLSFGGEYNGGRNAWGFHGSLPWAGPFWPGVAEKRGRRGYTLFTGNGLFRTSMFRELEGFDEIFSPMGWEDVDLCTRAWKRGYASLYEPSSVVYHKSSASVSRAFTPWRYRVLSARNSLIWFYANTGSRRLWARFGLLLAPTLLACLLTGRFAQVAGFLRSLEYLGACRARFRRDAKRAAFSDERVREECRLDLP